MQSLVKSDTSAMGEQVMRWLAEMSAKLRSFHSE